MNIQRLLTNTLIYILKDASINDPVQTKFAIISTFYDPVFQTMAGVVAARQLVLLSNPTKQAAILASGGLTKVGLSQLQLLF